MGNVSSFKRVLSIVLAATVMLAFSFSMTFAASTSPTKAKTDKGNKGGKYGIYTLYSKNKTATLTGTTKAVKSKKRIEISNIYTKNGKTYKITKVKAKVFSKAKKMKVLNIKAKSLKAKNLSAKAFKGLKKSQLKKVKVYINKKNKDKKALKKKLIKMGFKKANIKFKKF